MAKNDKVVVTLDSSRTNMEYADLAKDYLYFAAKIKTLTDQKNEAGRKLLQRFDGNNVKTFSMEDGELTVTKVEGSEKDSFDWRQLYEDHPELVKILDQYKGKTAKSADYVKVSRKDKK